jgi:hypothetical protein
MEKFVERVDSFVAFRLLRANRHPILVSSPAANLFALRLLFQGHELFQVYKLGVSSPQFFNFHFVSANVS